MNTGDYIALLDPSYSTSNNIPSNLGDAFISKSIVKILTQLFPQKEIKKFATHEFLTRKEMKIINHAEYSFIGGTNLLFSDMLTWREFKIRPGRLLWLFPGLKDLVLFGTGWGQGYQRPVTLRSKILYKKILHPTLVHSTRDSYTANKIKKNTGYEVINTSCPTMWNIERVDANRIYSVNTCLFTLTDYNKRYEQDTRFIGLLFEQFSNLVFFPQGENDLDYLTSLEIYKKNKTRIFLLDHSLNSFEEFIEKEDYCYIGTRLHAGIKCLQSRKDALVIGLDHRALEIAKDINFPVINWNNEKALLSWIQGKPFFNLPITIPLDNISLWKDQF